VQHGLVGNITPVNTVQPSELDDLLQSLRVDDEVFDADDEDSDSDTLVSSSSQSRRLSSSSSPFDRSAVGTPPTSPPAAPVFAPWERLNADTLPLMPPTPRIQRMEHVDILTFELLPQRARPSTDPVFVRGGNAFFGGR
jgi:hypothetical protein